MRGNDQIIGLLNELLASELTAHDQYLLHAEMAKNWGFLRLGERLHEESLGERKHADLLIERILFLEGTPEMKHHPVVHAASVKAQLENLLQLEYAAINDYNAAIGKAREAGDNATESLLTGILNDEQGDTQWIESQLTLIAQVGEPNYLSQQMH